VEIAAAMIREQPPHDWWETICRVNTNLPLEALLHPLNRMLRGWTTYFKYGCSHATFSYLRSYLWKQVVRWQER
jgi:RNA-directed DNA polymerase